MDEQERFEATVRVTVRRVSDGRRVGPDAVGTFDLSRPMTPGQLGEAAIRAAQQVSQGLTAAQLLTRTQFAVREFARKPSTRRIVAVGAQLLRQGAAQLEDAQARVSAKLVAQAPMPEADEDIG